MSKFKKYSIWIVIIVAVIGGFFYFRSSKPKIQYTTEEIRKVNVLQTVSVTGELAADSQVDLAFKLGGKVQELAVAVGDRVTVGQKLVKVDATSLTTNLRAAEQDYRYQKNVLDNIKRRDETYNRDQRVAQEALVEKARLAIIDAQNKFADVAIYAPFDGVVIGRSIEIGELAVANSPVVTVAKTGDLILQSNIPESDIIKIATGQRADVNLDAFSATEIFDAEVYDIEPAATVIQDVVYYKTKLRFVNPDPRFKHGMSADIDIKTAEKSNTLAVPARAIKTEGEKKYVEIMKNAETQEIEKRYIQIGLEGDEGLIEVTTGLSEGEKVVTFSK